MAEPEKTQFADGSDDYLNGASQMAKVAKSAGKSVGKVAAKSAQAGASAAGATVKAACRAEKQSQESRPVQQLEDRWGRSFLRYGHFAILLRRS